MTSPYDNLRRYCLFVGHDRSGASLVSAALDAHPHAIISHQSGLLRHMQIGIAREELFSWILTTSQVQAEKGRLDIAGISYPVPSQSQGSAKPLYVIGDEDPEEICRVLSKGDWRQIDRLYASVALRIKWIHVIRHPLDTIGEMSTKGSIESMEHAIKDYFRWADVISLVKERVLSSDVIDVYREQWHKSPIDELRRLCVMLDLDILHDYNEDCAALVERDKRSSHEAYQWASGQKEEIMERASAYPWLKRYLR